MEYLSQQDQNTDEYKQLMPILIRMVGYASSYIMNEELNDSNNLLLR